MSRFLVGRLWWIATLIAFASAAALGWLVFLSPMLAAKHVEVEGNKQVATDEVRAVANVPIGAAMVKLPLDSIAERVEGLDAVASAEIEREWPNTVRIVVTERRAVAMTETAQGYGLVGSDGQVYTVVATEPSALPELVDVTAQLDGQLDISSQTTPATDASTAFTVARSMSRQLRGHVASIDALSPSAVRLTLRNGVVVDWGSAEASVHKSAVLLVLLRRHANDRNDRNDRNDNAQQLATPSRYDVSVPDAPAWSN